MCVVFLTFIVLILNTLSLISKWIILYFLRLTRFFATHLGLISSLILLTMWTLSTLLINLLLLPIFIQVLQGTAGFCLKMIRLSFRISIFPWRELGLLTSWETLYLLYPKRWSFLKRPLEKYKRTPPSLSSLIDYT